MGEKIKSTKSDSYTGKIVLLWFVLFFVTIGAVNFYFVRTAILSNTGVITEQAYEKGLAYNEELKKAEEQNALGIKDTMVFENNTLTWSLLDSHETPVTGASVQARIIRNIQSGEDVKIDLPQISDGVYAVTLDLPHTGKWTAKLTAQWDDHTYERSYGLNVE